MRCHSRRSRRSSMPLTTHTSPFHVVTAARSPPGRKSKAPNRSQERHGFSSGQVNVSTANGPSPRPISPRVVRRSGQRGGPPCVQRSSGSGGSAAFTSSSNCAMSAAAPPKVKILRRRRSLEGGNRRTDVAFGRGDPVRSSSPRARRGHRDRRARQRLRAARLARPPNSGTAGGHSGPAGPARTTPRRPSPRPKGRPRAFG
jgi:hypothetical protein